MAAIQLNEQIVQIQDGGTLIRVISEAAIGVLTISGFVDVTTGSPTKSFRYSINGGIDWSAWATLTVPALTALSFNLKDLVVFELKYTSSTPTIGVTSIQINGTQDDNQIKGGSFFQNSMFSDYFNISDAEMLEWVMNVLKKTYTNGVAKFISRLNETQSSKDFIALWQSIITYFAMFVRYANEYIQFYNNSDLLKEYLEQKGLKTSIFDTITDRQYLMENFNKQIAHRGTMRIVDRDAYELLLGEFMRLIDYKNFEDEFLFNLYKPEHFGWCMGRSSPMHRGLYLNDNINKAYETQSYEIKDKTLYPNFGAVSLVVDPSCPTPSNTALQFGFGEGIGGTDVGGFGIKVNPNLDYEVSFLIRLESTDPTDSIEFFLQTFDKNSNLLSSGTKSAKTGILQQSFGDIKFMRNDKYIFVRGIIYNQYKSVDPSDSLNINQASNLIWNSNVQYMIPQIQNNSTGTMYIAALRILPLLTPYSRGFIQLKNWIDVWAVKRNQELTKQEIKDFARKYLIPYNSILELNVIGEYLYDGILDPPPVINTDMLKVYFRYNISTPPNNLQFAWEMGVGTPATTLPNYASGASATNGGFVYVLELTPTERDVYGNILTKARIQITSTTDLAIKQIKVWWNGSALTITGATLLATIPISSFNTWVDFSSMNIPIPTNSDGLTDYLILQITS